MIDPQAEPQSHPGRLSWFVCREGVIDPLTGKPSAVTPPTPATPDQPTETRQ